jgi:hypothetical protein
MICVFSEISLWVYFVALAAICMVQKVLELGIESAVVLWRIYSLMFTGDRNTFMVIIINKPI